MLVARWAHRKDPPSCPSQAAREPLPRFQGGWIQTLHEQDAGRVAYYCLIRPFGGDIAKVATSFPRRVIAVLARDDLVRIFTIAQEAPCLTRRNPYCLPRPRLLTYPTSSMGDLRSIEGKRHAILGGDSPDSPVHCLGWLLLLWSLASALLQCPASVLPYLRAGRRPARTTVHTGTCNRRLREAAHVRAVSRHKHGRSVTPPDIHCQQPVAGALIVASVNATRARLLPGSHRSPDGDGLAVEEAVPLSRGRLAIVNRNGRESSAP
jgi:hypothetical protein